MKDEFLALRVSSVVALIIGGILIGWCMAHPDLPAALLAGLAFVCVREDAQTSFMEGAYHRSRLVWRRIGAVATDKLGSNIVPIKGPAA